MKPTDFATQLSRYLGIYLPGQSGGSTNTVRSYRDTFSLFLKYCNDDRKIPPRKLTLERIDRHLVEEFLLWLENERNCCAGTRNNRLAAIHAFYRYLQFEMPHLLSRIQDILSIPYKKTQQKVMSYLTLDGVKALLEQPDTGTASGRRDLTMLSLLYDTGARVQELVDLKMEDVRFSTPTVIRLTGKGNKARLVPHHGSDRSSAQTISEKTRFQLCGAWWISVILQPHGAKADPCRSKPIFSRNICYWHSTLATPHCRNPFRRIA